MNYYKPLKAIPILSKCDLQYHLSHSLSNFSMGFIINWPYYSIGGADYGSVRVGAFMGRKIIKSTASAMMSSANGMNPDELEDNCVEMLEAEASLDYLCNVAPHR